MVPPLQKMRGFHWLEQEKVPRLSPTRLAYVGLRDLDPGEKAFIRALGIKAYTMHEVDRHGIGKASPLWLCVRGRTVPAGGSCAHLGARPRPRTRVLIRNHNRAFR